MVRDQCELHSLFEPYIYPISSRVNALIMPIGKQFEAL
jgi:hypothetical protein